VLPAETRKLYNELWISLGVAGEENSGSLLQKLLDLFSLS